MTVDLSIYTCTATYPSGLNCHDECGEACEPQYKDWCDGCKNSYDPPGAGHELST